MGCPNIPGESCVLQSETGPCTEYTDKWFYDMKYGHINQDMEVENYNLCLYRWLCEVLVRRLRGREESSRHGGGVSGQVRQSSGLSSLLPASSDGSLSGRLQRMVL